MSIQWNSLQIKCVIGYTQDALSANKISPGVISEMLVLRNFTMLL